MKKIIITLVALVAIVGLNGCGSGGSDAPSNATTLFLVDERGFSYGGVPYKCDSMRDWGVTASNGEFTFFPPDNCQFDFLGLNGDHGHGFFDDDIVRIVDFANDGKGGIPYECSAFGASSTFNDGSFFYDTDDACVFFL